MMIYDEQLKNMQKYLDDLKSGKHDEAILKAYEEYENNYIKRHKEVTSDEYLDWLVQFTEENNHWSDDDFLYNDEISEEDSRKVQLLSTLFSYLEQLKDEQNVIFSPKDLEKKDQYFEETLLAKIRGNFYKLCLAVGQGAFVTIEKLEKIPNRYIVVDEILSESEKEALSLIECIIINKDIPLTNEELLNAISKLTTEVTLSTYNNDSFKYWRKNQQRKFLYKSSNEIDKLKNENCFVITKENTNDILIISLGILTKKEIEFI